MACDKSLCSNPSPVPVSKILGGVSDLLSSPFLRLLSQSPPSHSATTVVLAAQAPKPESSLSPQCPSLPWSRCRNSQWLCLQNAVGSPPFSPAYLLPVRAACIPHLMGPPVSFWPPCLNHASLWTLLLLVATRGASNKLNQETLDTKAHLLCHSAYRKCLAEANPQTEQVAGCQGLG